MVVGYSNWQNNQLVKSDKTISITKTVIQENPVLLDSVYTVSGKKIGYLVYNQFIPGPNGSEVNTYDLQGIEPFTMIFVQQAAGLTLTELRWDGSKKYITVKDDKQPHIWSSVTLYTPEMSKQREAWFAQWLQEQTFSAESIRKFHQEGGKMTGDFYSIRMNRPGLVSTMSITTVVADTDMLTMHYEDLAKGTHAQETIQRKAYLHTI